IYFETVHKHKNGTLIPVEIFIQYIPPSDEPGRFVAFVRDISERKRIEMMKNQFISTVSHELRTPLTAVNGAISLISSGKIEPSRASDLIGIAQKNAMRLAELIDDLLDMEKLSQGKIRMEIEKKNLTEILQQSLNQIQSYNADSEITFRFLSEPKAVFVNVDEKRLQQVMANLLSNAAKFSPEKSSVDVSLHRNNGNVRVEVKDYGSGIPEEFRSRIFHKFAQADSSDSRKKGGTGLGLAISKELIQQMGGRIGFHSGKKGGCTFYFELPVAS
ncbi:MAG: PAS domain-containing sensor histidine kinase, partial [Spirochaetia bacterium]|nr:PAS domain-containing sensor histidine kinase [Spirochaetia bacterium]